MINPAATWAKGLEQAHEELFAPRGLTMLQGDFIVAMLVAVFCLVVKYCIALIPLKAENAEQRKKMDEFIFKVSWRTLTTVVGLTLMVSKDYFWDPHNRLYPMGADGTPQCTHPIEADERFYYILIFGYYLEHFVTQFTDPSADRSDFIAMFVHHVVTLSLIAASYASGESHVGIVVAACHEPSDLFLGMAKMARYVFSTMSVLSDIFFVCFLISWIAFRLILFPSKCILVFLNSASVSASGAITSWERNGCRDLYQTEGHLWGFGVFRLCLLGGMCLLCCLHVYWSFLIINVLLKKCKTGHLDDVRSGAEKDKDE